MKKFIFVCFCILVLGLVARWLCFNVFIVPRWIPESSLNIESITLKTTQFHGELTTIKIDGSEEVDNIYNLMKNTPIKKLLFVPRHYDLENSDVFIGITIRVKTGEEFTYRILGLQNEQDLVKAQGEDDFYWIYGKENKELENCLLSFFE